MPDHFPADPPQSAATAEAGLRAQLEADPLQHRAALAMAGMQLGDGRVDEAVALLQLHADDRDCGDLLREYFVGERLNDDAQRLLARRGSDASASGLVDQAIASHLRGDLDGAMQYCRLALTSDGGYAPAHNHQGRALFNARRAEQARGAFLQAVRIAPNYAEAWHNLAHALRDAGELAQAERAYGHSLQLRPAYRSARLNLGIVQMALGRPADALESFRALLTIDPGNADGWFNLAVCEHLLRRYDEARQSYGHAIARDPHNPRAHLQLGRLGNEIQDSEGALLQFRKALDLNPRDAEAWSEIAMLHQHAGRLDESARAVAAGLAAVPGDPGLRFELAKIAHRRGDVDAALRGLREIDPQALHPRLHQHYHYEFALALDQANDYAAARAAFERGNALAARSPRAQATDMHAFDHELDAIEAWLRDGAPATIPEPGEDNGEDLCFLFGFPRSGTALIESLFDGHPDIASIAEQPTIERLIQGLASMPGGYPAALATMDRTGRTALRRQYRQIVAELLGDRAGAAKRIIDRMPIRSVHAAFIQRLFPRARLLLALRHPCDVVLANYMQQHAANEVSVHFHTLAETVRIYDRAMRVLEATLKTVPLREASVHYEDLSDDPEGALREICAFLELAWHGEPDAGDADAKGAHHIITSSSHDVATPVEQRAGGRWRNHRGALEEFLPVLRPHAERFGYAID